MFYTLYIIISCLICYSTIAIIQHGPILQSKALYEFQVPIVGFCDEYLKKKKKKKKKKGVNLINIPAESVLCGGATYCTFPKQLLLLTGGGKMSLGTLRAAPNVVNSESTPGRA